MNTDIEVTVAPKGMNEAVLARRMGVSRDRLRGLRRGLEEGVHWAKAGRSVVWLPEGQGQASKLVGEALGVRMEGDEPALGDRGPPQEATIEIAQLRVVRRVLNPHIVLCERLNDGPALGDRGLPQRVRVRSSENFIPGMMLRARRVDGDLWELQGRCPRTKGRW